MTRLSLLELMKESEIMAEARCAGGAWIEDVVVLALDRMEGRFLGAVGACGVLAIVCIMYGLYGITIITDVTSKLL